MSKKCTPLWREAHFKVKSAKNWGARSTFGRSDVLLRGRRSTKDMFIRDVRRSGRWFPERGCILEHQIFRFAEMILRDRCSTSFDLASLFRGRRSTFNRWTGKIAKHKTHRYEAVSSALKFPFLKEVSQTCFVFDVVNFKKWGGLAELLCFWCCQLQKWGSLAEVLRFWCCQLGKNSKVFKLADRQVDRQTDREIDR